LVASIVLAIAGAPAERAIAAQSPAPGHHFFAVSPNDAYQPDHAGVVVQGLGMGSCDSREAPTKAMTVRYIEGDTPVWTEISAQATCGSISDYERHISSIISYIQANVTSSGIGKYWAGFMMDEETGWMFSPAQLETLNGYISSQMESLSGVPWWSLEGFVSDGDDGDGCAWSHATYDAVLGDGWQAEQIEHDCNVDLVNYAVTDTAVTWNSTYYAPGMTEASASGAVNTSTYAVVFGVRRHFLPLEQRVARRLI
jgi:hypothetical protein